MSLGHFHLVCDLPLINQGRTILARRKADSELFILKEFSFADAATHVEAQTLSRLSQDNLTRVVQLFNDEKTQKFYVQIEFCDGGSIFHAISKMLASHTHFPEEVISEWFAQVFDAALTLHSNQIGHGNISAKSVFLSASQKIAKVGVLQHKGERDEHVNEKAMQDDIFLLGALLYHVCNLKLPEGINLNSIIPDKAIWGNRVQIPTQYSPELSALINRLMSGDSKNLSDFANDPWLKPALHNREALLQAAFAEEDAIKNKCIRIPKEPVSWGYTCENGPNTWSKSFPSGNGKHQSPVAIETTAPYVQYDPTLGPLNLDYSQCKATTIYNSGHAFQVNFDARCPATLTGGPLNSTYQLAQYHAHWGANDACFGAEHIINGCVYPAEIHFVHYNTKYPSFIDALDHEDGLAVVGFYVKAGEEGSKAADALQAVVDEMHLIRFRPQEVKLPAAASNVRDMMPDQLNRYFTYPGSLTAPPLKECVTWIMMVDILTFTPAQLAAFRDLRRLNCFDHVDDNVRPVCPLNGRIVRSSFPPSEIESIFPPNVAENACSE